MPCTSPKIGISLTRSGSVSAPTRRGGSGPSSRTATSCSCCTKSRGTASESVAARTFSDRRTGSGSSSRESSGIPNLAEHVNDFSRAADELEAKYQTATMARDYFKVLEEAAPILRSAANMHSTLQSARDADHEDQGLIGVRDTAGDVVRSLELLCTDAKNALDYDIAKSTEEQAVLGEEAVRSGLRLNILVAIFLPLTTLSGMFGMNVTTGLERAPAWFAWAIFALGVAIGLVVRGWVMRGVRPELVNPREVARRL